MQTVTKKKPTEKIILGIDPGTNIMGYGLILVTGNKMSLLQFGVIKLQKYSDHALKLQKIFRCISRIIEEFHPDEVALEAPFFGKNVQSMLKLGRAQGVAMAAALNMDIPIKEYAPLKVKKAVTGKGASSKEQVAGMLQHLLNMKEIPDLLDATDALAVAVCHHFNSNSPQKKHDSWNSFLKNNPNRIK